MSEASVLVKRLKEARLQAGLTQERLGILAGIDEYSASARVNQYERNKHTPDYLMVRKFAEVLNRPVAYFYADDDMQAELLTCFHSLSPDDKQSILAQIKTMAGEGLV